MKDAREINQMIARLEFIKPLIPRYKLYRDSNWEAIDCQIAVLEHRLNENDVWNRWPTHHQDQDLYNRERALETIKWLYDGGQDLVELWQKGQ